MRATDSYAIVKADTISERGDRLTTMEICMRRFVLAEFNTHRLFSRNSASSRAIPLKLMLQRAIARPVVFPMEQKGMSGGEELSDEAREEATEMWDNAADAAVEHARALGELKVHKSVANRLLEPFLMHTVIVTSTDWENFFDQRCSKLAQPEIREVAEMMRDVMAISVPDNADEETWHLPYIQEDDVEEVTNRVAGFGPSYWEALAHISAARCARVSYLTQDGQRDINEDLAMYSRLVSADPPHWSPLEHVATPWLTNVQKGTLWFEDEEGVNERVSLSGPLVGNLTGWRSLRTTVEAKQGISTLR